MRYLLLIILLFTCGASHSQNLVPNNSFETSTGFPSDAGQWSLCPPWSNVNGVVAVGFPYASPDYLHTSGTGIVGMPGSIFATLMPHTGNAVMGFLASASQSVPDFREYLGIELTTPMIPGETYTVSFWTTNGASNQYSGSASNHVGVHFSVGPLTQVDHEPIGVTPQLEIPGQPWSTNWIQHTFTIVATTAWTHLTVGVFVPDSQVTTVMHEPTADFPPQSYYFIDDFEVILQDPTLVVTGDLLICEGESTTLTASGGTTFSWAESTAPSTIIGTGSTLTVSPPQTTTYLVYSESDTTDVTVQVVPYPEIAVTSAVICPGESESLIASGADTYVWSPATGLNTTTGATVITSTPVSTIYTVIGTTNGCSDTTQSTVTVLPEPVIVVNDAQVCPGYSAVLSATGADDYAWSPATGLDATTGPSVTATPTATTIYTVTGTLNGCTASVDATVTVTEPLAISVNDFQICAGGTAVLIAEGAATYTWSPDVSFVLPDGSRVLASPAVTTVYTVIGTNADNTCSGTAQATVELIDHVEMDLSANPNPVLAEYPLVSFHGEPANETLVWDFGDGTSAEGPTIEHLYPTDVEGTYTVMLIATTAGGCIDTLYTDIVVESGGLYYVPNAFTPNNDGINSIFKPVFSLGFDAKKYQLSIYNRWGETVFETNKFDEGWDGTYRSEQCEDGVYTWKITTGKEATAESLEITGFVTLLR